MAMTRKMLKAMGIEEEKIDEIIEAHTEVTNALKAERDDYKAKVEKLNGVQKELDELKAAGDGGYKAKYEAEFTAHEALKNKIADEQRMGSLDKAVRAYYEGKNIKGKNLNIAMRGTDLSKLELDGDKIKDTKALDDLVTGDYAGLVSTTTVEGAETASPPSNNGSVVTRESILKIKDTTERQKAIAEHLELFTGKGE